jgi:hypothetical protein
MKTIAIITSTVLFSTFFVFAQAGNGNLKSHNNKQVAQPTEDKDKKIMVSEKAEGGVNGNPNLEIIYQNLTAEERAAIIQELLNKNGNRVQVVH